jgi:Mg/Co/Ni transporter MgtE
MNTEVIQLKDEFGAEFAGKYLFKEITWAKRNRIIQKNTKYNNLTGEVVSSDFIAIQAETIMASLHGQPESKPITLQRLLSEEDGIPIELGEIFSKVVNRLNGLSHEDLRFLLAQLSEDDRTQLLASLGYAKNSAGPSPNSDANQPKQSSPSL